MLNKKLNILRNGGKEKSVQIKILSKQLNMEIIKKLKFCLNLVKKVK